MKNEDVVCVVLRITSENNLGWFGFLFLIANVGERKYYRSMSLNLVPHRKRRKGLLPIDPLRLTFTAGYNIRQVGS